MAASGDPTECLEGGVTLLPVQMPTLPLESMAPSPCIEAIFADATVRINGLPAVITLRMVLDTLARRT